MPVETILRSILRIASTTRRSDTFGKRNVAGYLMDICMARAPVHLLPDGLHAARLHLVSPEQAAWTVLHWLACFTSERPYCAAVSLLRPQATRDNSTLVCAALKHTKSLGRVRTKLRSISV